MKAYRCSREIRGRLPAPRRTMAPIRWYGGKGRLAHKIVPLLPPGQVYVEPYCGAASVFWHLEPPRPVEVLNDLDGDIINLFRVLQRPRAFASLAHRITWTPHSRAEFVRALRTKSSDPIERAWATMVRHSQGFAGKAKCAGNWQRGFGSSCGMAKEASDWRKRIERLQWWHDRLTRVQLDNRDALEVIRHWDSPDTVFYVDPPYVQDTRVKGRRNDYAHECSDDHHAQLVDVLRAIKGKAVLSGYATGIYAPLRRDGWKVRRFEVACYASRARSKRTEVAWISNAPGGQDDQDHCRGRQRS